MSWILRNSRLLRVAGARSAARPVSSLRFGRRPQARQAAALGIQTLEQLQAPCFAVAGKRQAACGGAKLAVSEGRAAHTSPRSEAPAATNEVAVISHGPGGWRAAREYSCRHTWNGTMPALTPCHHRHQDVAAGGLCPLHAQHVEPEDAVGLRSEGPRRHFPAQMMLKHSPQKESVVVSHCRVYGA